MRHPEVMKSFQLESINQEIDELSLNFRWLIISRLWWKVIIIIISSVLKKLSWTSERGEISEVLLDSLAGSDLRVSQNVFKRIIRIVTKLEMFQNIEKFSKCLEIFKKSLEIF